MISHEKLWKQRPNSSCWTKWKAENNGQKNIPCSCIQDGHLWVNPAFVKSNEKEAGIIDPRLQRVWDFHIQLYHGIENLVIVLRRKWLLGLICLSYKLFYRSTKKNWTIGANVKSVYVVLSLRWMKVTIIETSERLPEPLVWRQRGRLCEWHLVTQMVVVFVHQVRWGEGTRGYQWRLLWKKKKV